MVGGDDDEVYIWSGTETKAMILDKKATIIENQASLNFEGHQIEITDVVKVLGVIIDDKLTLSQQ